LKTWKPRETSLRELSKRSVKSMGRLSRKYWSNPPKSSP
jgi:hypothetical protein